MSSIERIPTTPNDNILKTLDTLQNELIILRNEVQEEIKLEEVKALIEGTFNILNSINWKATINEISQYYIIDAKINEQVLFLFVLYKFILKMIYGFNFGTSIFDQDLRDHIALKAYLNEINELHSEMSYDNKYPSLNEIIQIIEKVIALLNHYN